MKKCIRKFGSAAEAEAADRAYYRSLTPQQRIDVFLELIENANCESSKGFERVYRVVKLEKS